MHTREQAIMAACLRHLEKILQDAGLGKGELERNLHREFDAVYRMPRQGLSFVIDVKLSLQPYQVERLASERLMTAEPERSLIFVRNLPQSVLSKCEEHGVLVLDEDGNGSLKIPGLYYHRYTPSKKGGSSGKGRSAIFSAKASRVARAMLACYPRRWTQVELAEKTDVTPGYVSKVVSQMLAEDYLRRDHDSLRIVSADRLLDDWTEAVRPKSKCKEKNTSGAAARVAPVAMFYHGDEQALLKYSMMQALVTHTGQHALAGVIAIELQGTRIVGEVEQALGPDHAYRVPIQGSFNPQSNVLEVTCDYRVIRWSLWHLALAIESPKVGSSRVDLRESWY